MAKPSHFPLFQPLKLGRIELANRMVMAPLTRNRAGEGNVPGDMTIEYYAQRASVGLIVAEATQVSAQAQGYVSTPGVHARADRGLAAGDRCCASAWRPHFVQLWHTGACHTRRSSRKRRPLWRHRPLRPRPRPTFGVGYTDTSVPRALETAEIAGIVNDFQSAARHAIEAGFDGVEIHGAIRLFDRCLPARWLQPPHRSIWRQH